MKNSIMTVGQAIKTIRKSKNITIQQLSDATGLSKPTLTGIENRQTQPRPESMKKISEALGVPENLIHIMTLQKKDVPRGKRILYGKLFPIIQELILEVAKAEE